MSYSMSLLATTKADLIAKATTEFANIVSLQPAHAVDHDQALAAATSFINAFAEPAAGKQFAVSIYGSVSGYFDDSDSSVTFFTPTGVSFSFSLGEVALAPT